MNLFEDFPVLMIDDQLNEDSAESKVLKEIIHSLNNKGFSVIESQMGEFDSKNNKWHVILADSQVSCILIGWNEEPSKEKLDKSMIRLINLILKFRERNPLIPIFLMTDKLELKNITLDIISQINGYIWKLEDTPDFIAGRIEIAVSKYLDGLQPPFFKKIIQYTEEYKYAWHTPGHAGGIAFLKSPIGRIFYKFFGENVFRSDLSISVPELGSLLDHTNAIKEAEANASKIFGSDRTYFVTNGNSTSNRIVWQSVVTSGDIVLVDRNCHKSIMHSIITAGAIPIYLLPSRNDYGIIGPVRIDELSKKAIDDKINNSPLIQDKNKKVKIAVITNSTYDGLCYNVEMVKHKLKDKNNVSLTENIHFDEAWFAYARFNTLYNKRYATYSQNRDNAFNLIFATQSTHKLLAAFSQAAMIHILDQKGNFSHDRFNEAYMMHCSTSPQYSIIASLDVAGKMMENGFGNISTQTSIEEANVFRKKVIDLGNEIHKMNPNDWWFDIWQPIDINGQPFSNMSENILNKHSNSWVLNPEDDWHGFESLEKDYCMLDPIKVTILTPGIVQTTDEMSEKGIPAPVLSKFLMSRGIVAEKTGFNSLLILFSIGITNGKSGELLSELYDFKKSYDGNMYLSDVFPDLSDKYENGMTIQDLCHKMHNFLKNNNYIKTFKKVYSTLPEQSTFPSTAYQELVNGNVVELELDKLNDKSAAVMVVPYPPGIPLVMPGELFNEDLIRYLKIFEEFDNTFPGFENDIHGVSRKEDKYHIFCVDM